MANQVRMAQIAGAALLERQALKAALVVREPKGRKVSRQIAKPSIRSYQRQPGLRERNLSRSMRPSCRCLLR